METAELLKKVRKIEIKARGLSTQQFAGEYHSAFKGRGMSFSEVREYQYGDDIRSIDWNVTARMNHPYIKVFSEDRELNVMLLIDVSGSGLFGTRKNIKKDQITELAAVIGFSALNNNDKIGALLFTDKVEKFIPPRKGKQHILRIIRDLIEFEPESKKTDVSAGLRYFRNVIKKRSTVIIISDFLSPDFSDALKITARKHDVVALHITDPAEGELPDVGLVPFSDPETGLLRMVDTSDKKTATLYKAAYMQRKDRLRNTFMKSRVDFAEIPTDGSYIRELMNLFKKRERK
jgi:uncharacterized protein (DUF58 family)